MKDVKMRDGMGPAQNSKCLDVVVHTPTRFIHPRLFSGGRNLSGETEPETRCDNKLLDFLITSYFTAIMDASNVLELIDQLDDDVDDLEESLAPLLKVALSDSASKLPLLDKAKLYVLVTYAIESILFGEN